jgi:hypothetical protein
MMANVWFFTGHRLQDLPTFKKLPNLHKKEASTCSYLVGLTN